MRHRRCHINVLPVELLSFIFVLATHSSTNPENIVPFNSESVKIPLLLSAVNRHWRSVALETSALWTSLCATVGAIEYNETSGRTSFNTSQLAAYLRRSRRYPVDVLIDARDQNWDFSEPEIRSAFEYSTYVPPFSITHMRTAMSILVPHLPRWRSLVILTDTWAPIHAGLCSLTAGLAESKASLLESLVLMRCNEYVSYSPEFQPSALVSPAFLEYGGIDLAGSFPRLKQLCLRGVHADWAQLPSSLQNSSTSLENMELSLHSPDVRPPLRDFYNLMMNCTHLRTLNLFGSGPYFVESWPDESKLPEEYLHAVSLPALEELVVGYRSIIDTINLFEMLDLPNIKSLTLEDATHPGDIDDIDAGTLLVYLADGQQMVHVETLLIWTDGHARPVPRATKGPELTERTLGGNKKSPQLPPRPLKQLEELTLKRVKAHPYHFQYLFLELISLKHLELCSTSISPFEPLSPGVHIRRENDAPVKKLMCPCPQLTSLTIRGYEEYTAAECDRLVSQVNLSRANVGASQLSDVEVLVSAATLKKRVLQEVEDLSNALMPPICRMRDDGLDYFDDFAYDSDRESSYEEDAFQLGGAFNDPLFDAYYGSRIVT